MEPTATLGEQAQTRELAALLDGPRKSRWFWREDLEQMQAAAQRRRHPLEHPAAVYRRYRPTQEWITHPTEPGVHGRAWRHHQSPAAPRRCWSPDPGTGPTPREHPGTANPTTTEWTARHE